MRRNHPHWTVIGTALTLSCVFTYLVVGRGWEMSAALLLISGTVLGVSGTALLVLLAFENKAERAETLRLAAKTAKDDLRDLRQWLTPRK